MSNPLQWDVFVSTQIPVVTTDLPPGVAGRRWSPISSTLISGERDAVLVDTFITVEQNRKLVEWIARSGKNLTTIYATHGHGDHFFGVNTIRERFPDARFVASRDVITIMRQQASSAFLDSFWNSRFPGQIDVNLAIAEELAGTVIELEGEKLVSVALGHTDTDNTTCLHVPSICLVVAVSIAFMGFWSPLSKCRRPAGAVIGGLCLCLSPSPSFWVPVPEPIRCHHVGRTLVHAAHARHWLATSAMSSRIEKPANALLGRPGARLPRAGRPLGTAGGYGGRSPTPFPGAFPRVPLYVPIGVLMRSHGRSHPFSCRFASS